MIWVFISATVLFGLLGCLELALGIRWAFDSVDFEDWALVVIIGFAVLLTWGAAALPWVLGLVGAS